jgi:hypothetical protein
MTEEELKHKVSYQNLLLYSLVLPPIGEDGGSENETKDMFDMFG